MSRRSTPRISRWRRNQVPKETGSASTSLPQGGGRFSNLELSLGTRTVTLLPLPSGSNGDLLSCRSAMTLPRAIQSSLARADYAAIEDDWLARLGQDPADLDYFV